MPHHHLQVEWTTGNFNLTDNNSVLEGQKSPSIHVVIAWSESQFLTVSIHRPDLQIKNKFRKLLKTN